VRVCYFGTYERGYPRNKVVIDALRQVGVEVEECHLPLWELTRHKTGKFLSPKSLLLFILRALWAYLRLIGWYLRRVGDAQVVIVGYIGQLDLLLARLLTILGRRRKLIFNPLVSLYDTLIDDRSLFSPGSLAADFLFSLDRWSFRLADRIILDTDVHIDYISKKFGIERGRFERVFIGADQDLFVPGPRNEQGSSFLVLFVGKFIPLHGIPHIIAAASLLEQDQDIRFEIVGSGQLHNQIMELCHRLKVKNIAFTDWIPYERLAEKMAQAHLCLGIFGDSGKASRVIPNKVFQGLAVGMPIITGDSPASRELLTHAQSAMLVPMANPQALAQAIRALKENRALRQKIAAGGYAVFQKRCAAEALGRQLKILCREALSRP
jgi:glycosyltransferase involved in cell wall biosynthesis